jgi:hypothetical protein
VRCCRPSQRVGIHMKPATVPTEFRVSGPWLEAVAGNPSDLKEIFNRRQS